jgi:hypothetical protein
MTRTEDDLRAAFTELERLAPDPDVVLAALYHRSHDKARARRTARPLWRRPLQVTLALTAAAAAATALTVTLASGHGRGTGQFTPLRARLVAAIDAARGDILSARVRLSGPGQNGGGEQTLTYPWYPRQGQRVRVHTLGWGANGRLFKDAESIFTMPARHGAPSTDPLDPGERGGADLNVTGTFFAVFPARHAWGKWHHLSLTLGLSADAAGIRHKLATGQFEIIRHGVLHGHKAIELSLVLPPSHRSGLHVTAALLWVDAATYLPMRQVLRFSDGKQDTTDYRFLPPTPTNLAKLRPVIPAGYHRTRLLPGQRPYK